MRGESTRAKNIIASDLDVADNVAAVVTITAAANDTWDVRGIYWSYDAAPTGGNLLVTIDGTTEVTEDIFAAGPGQMLFALEDREDGLRGAKNQEVVVTLAAGGAGIGGQLNVLYR